MVKWDFFDSLDLLLSSNEKEICQTLSTWIMHTPVRLLHIDFNIFLQFHSGLNIKRWWNKALLMVWTWFGKWLSQCKIKKEKRKPNTIGNEKGMLRPAEGRSYRTKSSQNPGIAKIGLNPIFPHSWHSAGLKTKARKFNSWPFDDKTNQFGSESTKKSWHVSHLPPFLAMPGFWELLARERFPKRTKSIFLDKKLWLAIYC